MIKHDEFKVKAFDDLKLFVQSWQAIKQPRAIIFLVHGLGEHSGRFCRMANKFAHAGHIFIAFDLRGHGNSSGERGHVQSYDIFMQDITVVLTFIKQKFPKIPIFLYGHSMGGNLVLNYVLRYHPRIEGVIVTSPWLRLAFEPSAFKLIISKTMNRIWPTFSQLSNLDVNALSRDSKIVNDYRKDSVVHSHVSARLFTEIYKSGRWALEHASEFSLPLLLMHGGADRITSHEASCEFANQLTNSENCTFKLWKNLYHEIHNEPEREEVFEFTIHWINTKYYQKIKFGTYQRAIVH